MEPSVLLLSAHTDLEENKRERMKGLCKMKALKKLTHRSLLSLLARVKVRPLNKMSDLSTNVR